MRNAKLAVMYLWLVVWALQLWLLVSWEHSCIVFCFSLIIVIVFRCLLIYLWAKATNIVLSLLQFVYCSPAHLHLALERVSSTPALIDNKPKSERRPPPPLPLTPQASIKNAWGHSSDQEDGVLPKFCNVLQLVFCFQHTMCVYMSLLIYK